MTEPVVYMRHVREAKLCRKDSRKWYERQGWVWSDFLANGIPAEKLIATGDPIVMAAVEAARREAARGSA